MAKVTVLGGGGWSIALAVVLNDNGNDVTIWSALDREVNDLKETRENKKSLPGIKIDEKIQVTGDLNLAVKENNPDLIVMGVASSFVRQTAARLKGLTKPGQVIMNVAKGIEEATLDTMTDMIEEEVPDAITAVLSGPSHAEEVAKHVPTSVVVGCKDQEIAKKIQAIFANDVFRVYTSDDMLGIQVGAALKNVIALAAGCADGIDCGDNTKAALITRGMAEIAELGVAMGGNMLTFSGLSGMGDLIVTCASMHSRNRRAGILMGQGKTMKEAMDEVEMVVEGVYSAKAAYKLAQKYQVSMPIVEEVNNVLFADKPVKDALNDLMNRDLKAEIKRGLWEK